LKYALFVNCIDWQHCVWQFMAKRLFAVIAQTKTAKEMQFGSAG